MQSPSKNTILVVVVALIVIAIFYLQSQKPARLTGEGKDVVGEVIQGVNNLPDRTKILTEKSMKYSKAKELSDPTGFINTDSFKLSDLVGKKVILIDFWTYSCINCKRTTPYLKAWDEKYKDSGLVIVGVHTPEFDFEKKYENVSNAVKKEGILYPVVLDSNKGTWSAYQNQYWPRKYLIDIDGYVVYDHIGEGGYEETEKAIQKVLNERNYALNLKDIVDTSMINPEGVVLMDQDRINSPEIYFGASRNRHLANGRANKTGAQNFIFPEKIILNSLYLTGTWNLMDEFAEMTSSSGKIVFKYDAKNVYFVGSSLQGSVIKILRDGKPLDKEAGKDVSAESTVLIQENRLYDLINGEDYGEHVLEIEITQPGLEAFTFTFG